MGYQLLAWRPPVPKPNGKPKMGWCDTHPKEPAHVTEVKNGGKKRKFCKSCWEQHKYGELGLKPCIFNR